MKKSIKRVMFFFIWMWVCIVFVAPQSVMAGCSTESVLLDNRYMGACGYTQSTSFTLAKDVNVTRIRIWYDTSVGGNTIAATMSGPSSYSSSSGTITKGGCQWSWCEAIWNLNQVLKAGTYTLTADSKSICSNPSGQTTLALYGCILEKDDNTVEGINPPDGVSSVDVNSNSNNAPVYMGNIVKSGGVATLSGNMELSVNFPAYNKPVDIWILIALPDGRFYTANESGKCLSYSSGSLAPVVSRVSGIKTEKTILTPFETGVSGTAFDPWPVDGTWTAYWLIAPEINGDILTAIAKENYELGFYSFQVHKTNTTTLVGPGGTTITLPSEVTESKTKVAVFENTATDLLSAGEQSASVALKIEIGNEKFVGGNAEYKISFPVTLNGVEPDRLRVMVQIGDGIRLPIIGDYDSGSKQYTVKTYGLGHNWLIGVVAGNPVSAIQSTTRNSANRPLSSKAASKLASSIWPSIDYKIFNESKTDPSRLSEDLIESEIRPIARDVLITLQGSGFTAPLLQQNQSEGGAYEMYLIDSDMKHGPGLKDSSYYYPPLANLLGRVYIFYPSHISNYADPSTWSLKNVIMHETFHAVQFGYKYSFGTVPDITDGSVWSTAAAYQEGTANLMGATYEEKGKIRAEDIYVESITSQHLLDKAVDDTEHSTPYSKQNFFAFLGKRYFANEGLTYLHPMFTAITASTSGQSGTTTDDYLLMYRQGMNSFLASRGLSLPEAYTEYALQRLYLHDSTYLLRESEKNNPLFAEKHLACSVTTNDGLLTPDKGYKIWESKAPDGFQFEPLSFADIKPLSSVAATLQVPYELPDSMKNGTLPVTISLGGGGQINQVMKEEGIRIQIIRLHDGVQVAEDPFVTVKDISSPVEVSLKGGITQLLFIIMNSYVKNIPVSVNMTVATLEVGLYVKPKGLTCCQADNTTGLFTNCIYGYGATTIATVTDADGKNITTYKTPVIVRGITISETPTFSAAPGAVYKVSVNYNYSWMDCACEKPDTSTECPSNNEIGTVTGTITIPADSSGSLVYSINHETQSFAIVK